MEFAKKHQTGHCWNMSYEEEQKILDQCAKEAEEGKVLTVSDVRKKLEEYLGRETTPNYAYGVLKRHGWRKVMP